MQTFETFIDGALSGRLGVNLTFAAVREWWLLWAKAEVRFFCDPFRKHKWR